MIDPKKYFQMSKLHIKKSLSIRIKLLPKNHEDISWCYNNLAFTYFDFESKAENKLDKALHFFELSKKINFLEFKGI